MPIYVGYSQKRRTVRITSAGKTQYLLCPPADIDLGAYLNDTSNLRNHTILWEQIKGTPVTLASEDTLGTSFPHSDTEDKTFRFWLDKGTNREQYKDVDIYYTPTSVVPKRSQNHELLYKSMTTPNLVQEPTFILPPAQGVFDSNVDTIPATKVTFDEVALLELLQSSIKFEILTDANYVVDPQDVYATYEAGEFAYALNLPNGVYKFRFYYDLGGVHSHVVTSPLVVCNSLADPEDAWAIDDVHNISHGLSRDLSNFVRYSIKRLPITDDNFFAWGCQAGLVNTNNQIISVGEEPVVTQLTPRTIGPDQYPDLLDINSIYNGVTHHLVDLTRLDPSNIGS